MAKKDFADNQHVQAELDKLENWIKAKIEFSFPMLKVKSFVQYDRQTDGFVGVFIVSHEKKDIAYSFFIAEKNPSPMIQRV